MKDNRISEEIAESERLVCRTGNIEFRKIRNAPKSIFYEGIKMYDSSPAIIKQFDGKQSFKRALKDYTLSTALYHYYLEI